MDIILNEVDKVISSEATYELRALLMKYNFQLHQFEEKSGLTLAHFLLEDDGFRAVSLDKITEVIDSVSLDYHFYPYCGKGDTSYGSSLRRTMREFDALCIARAEYLPQFERIWDHLGTHDAGVRVRYGLDAVELLIPFAVIAKYQVYYELPNIFSAYRQEFDSRHELLRLKFIWHSLAVTAFDNKVSFLGWRIQEYRKQKIELQKLREFHKQRDRFASWERAIFGICASS